VQRDDFRCGAAVSLGGGKPPLRRRTGSCAAASLAARFHRPEARCFHRGVSFRAEGRFSLWCSRIAGRGKTAASSPYRLLRGGFSCSPMSPGWSPVLPPGSQFPCGGTIFVVVQPYRRAGENGRLVAVPAPARRLLFV